MPQFLYSLTLLRSKFSCVYPDQGAKFKQGVENLSSATVEVMKREGKGFQLLARRWVVERTFAWLVKKRRLVVDYEKLPEKARIFHLHCDDSFNVKATNKSKITTTSLRFYLQTVSQTPKTFEICDFYN